MVTFLTEFGYMYGYNSIRELSGLELLEPLDAFQSAGEVKSY